MVQFARKFGYTPLDTIATKNKKSPAELNPSPLPVSKPTDLKQIIKTEINREHLQNDTISFNHAVNVWIAKAEDRLQTGDIKKRPLFIEDDVIIVDDIDTKFDQRKCSSSVKCNKLEGESNALLPIPDHLQNEFSYVTDVCRDVQVKLEPVEIVEGRVVWY